MTVKETQRSEKNRKTLPEERYDIKLFKQAVKASKEAKILERRTKKRKEFLRGLLSISIVFAVGLLIYFLLPLFAPKDEYTLAQERPVVLDFESIESEEISFEKDLSIKVGDISGESVIAFNPSNGDILYEKNINEKRSIASLTKLLTAIIVLENYKLDEVINVSVENIPEDLDWKLGLKEGDKISVENLLKAMLMSSYNDTGYIIANAYPYGGYPGFIKAMNRKAEALKMKSSHFSNPAGIDEEGNYSTALDVAILTSVARKYPDILRIVGMGKDVVNWSSEKGLMNREVQTTNQLYGVNRYIKGLKTGITDLAGQCFTGYFVYPNGKELITVVIDSKDRFGDTTLLEKYTRELLK